MSTPTRTRLHDQPQREEANGSNSTPASLMKIRPRTRASLEFHAATNTEHHSTPPHGAVSIPPQGRTVIEAAQIPIRMPVSMSTRTGTSPATTGKPTRRTSPRKAPLSTSTISLSDQQQSAEAGPSKLPPTPSPARSSPKTKHTMRKSNARNDPGPGPSSPRAPARAEKRVLPARIRRAAGGGAEGTRDLEEMVMDWLERYGEPATSPPDTLPILITSLPLEYLTPPVQSYPPAGLAISDEPATSTSTSTVTPIKAQVLLSPTLRAANTNLGGVSSTNDKSGLYKGKGKEVIETPDWIIVKPGEDDQEEAREELDAALRGLGPGRMGRGPLSPVKRLRKSFGGHGHDEDLEDTSDAHYQSLHRRYEALERRQRKDERDKLHYEKFKMRSRIDSLRGMSVHAWTAIVNTVLARRPPPVTVDSTHLAEADRQQAEEESDIWAAGRRKVHERGVEWLRSRLVKEGEEVMRRYEELLPPDSRRPKHPDSRTSTPARSMTSMTPPPSHLLTIPHVNTTANAAIPARVAALRDDLRAPRYRASEPALRPEERTSETIRSIPKIRSEGRVRRKRKRDDVHYDDDAQSDNDAKDYSHKGRKRGLVVPTTRTLRAVAPKSTSRAEHVSDSDPDEDAGSEEEEEGADGMESVERGDRGGRSSSPMTELSSDSEGGTASVAATSEAEDKPNLPTGGKGSSTRSPPSTELGGKEVKVLSRSVPRSGSGPRGSVAGHPSDIARSPITDTQRMDMQGEYQTPGGASRPTRQRSARTTVSVKTAPSPTVRTTRSSAQGDESSAAQTGGPQNKPLVEIDVRSSAPPRRSSLGSAADEDYAPPAFNSGKRYGTLADKLPLDVFGVLPELTADEVMEMDRVEARL